MTIKSTFEECLLIGTNAMSTLTSSLEDEKFTEQLEAAVNLIHEINGRLVISGMGKSGIIGKKLVATFASTGTPSLFLHPAEASHGDLGMFAKVMYYYLCHFLGKAVN